MAAALTSETRGQTLILTISNPEMRNALGPEIYAAGVEALGGHAVGRVTVRADDDQGFAHVSISRTSFEAILGRLPRFQDRAGTPSTVPRFSAGG
jgi:hypothetical protein